MKIKKCIYENNILTFLIILFLSFFLQVHTSLTTENSKNNFKNSFFEVDKGSMKLRDIIIHLESNFRDQITEKKIKVDFISDFNNQGILLNFNSDEIEMNDQDENMKQIIRNYFRTDSPEENQYKYIIDYRLVHNCEFKSAVEISESKEEKNQKNEILFSVNKIEKNLDFLKNTSELDANNNSSSESVGLVSSQFLNVKIQFFSSKSNPLPLNSSFYLQKQNFIHKITSQCKQRKKLIQNLKDKLMNLFSKQISLHSRLTTIKSDLSSKKLEKSNLDKFIIESQQFLMEKDSLKIISKNQINHLKTLRNNSIKLKNKSLNEKKFIEEKLIEIDKKIKSIELTLENKKSLYLSLEGEINSLNEEENKQSKEIINLRKNYIELEEIVNKIKSDKNEMEIDGESLKEDIFSLKKQKIELNKNINLILKDISYMNSILEKDKKSKEEIEKKNEEEISSMKEIDKKIKELLDEKNKKMKIVKNNYDKINKQKDIIIQNENKINQLNFKKIQTDQMLEINVKKLNDTKEKHEYMQSQIIDASKKFQVYDDNLKYINETITQSSLVLDQAKEAIKQKRKNFDEVSLMTKKIITEKINLQSTKSQLDMEFKRIINDMNNNDIQIKNFEFEIKKQENHSVNSFLRQGEGTNTGNTNMKDKSDSILDEYTTEQLSLNKQIKDFEENLKNYKKEEKNNQDKFQQILKDLSITIPESNLLLDLLRDEFKNNFNFSKLKNLLNKLKN